MLCDFNKKISTQLLLFSKYLFIYAYNISFDCSAFIKMISSRFISFFGYTYTGDKKTISRSLVEDWLALKWWDWDIEALEEYR
ncbi:hypothetical protein GCM10008025_18790 [Ornithinibacillus halotolerans]|jgi:hypothetical protein|uniref:Uncharacterized protein n=1 Tax=Ornithinibacillus halotolerans TaxID=1274357 RepID=A0A916RXE0_9BACI|nr:hypothetical protein GCM10008025_18790 [Ornithinibacillus halotolerans]